MVGLVVATHGRFGEELIRSAELIAGKCKNVMALSLEKDDNLLEFGNKILEAIETLEQGDGVLVFTDLLGGTPSNMATLNARKLNYFCLTGVNMPMILEFIMSSGEGLLLSDLVERCYQSASDGVKFTNKL